jgi:hypothetical protein
LWHATRKLRGPTRTSRRGNHAGESVAGGLKPRVPAHRLPLWLVRRKLGGDWVRIRHKKKRIFVGEGVQFQVRRPFVTHK